MKINESKPNFDKLKLLHKFLEKNSSEKKYIMGRSPQGHAIDVMKIVDIDGIIDDFSDVKDFYGKPVVRSCDIPLNSNILVCCSVNPVSAIRNLKEKGFTNILEYSFFFKNMKDSGLSALILDTFEDEFNSNKEKFEWTYNLLADAESRSVFDAIVNYRITGDLTWMEKFKFLPKEQYFPSFLNLNNETFIDIGGFDGDTTLFFFRAMSKLQENLFFRTMSKQFY